MRREVKLITFVFAAVAGILLVLGFLSQIRRTSLTLQQVQAAQHELQQVACDNASHDAVILEAIRRLARDFGTTIPMLPGEPTPCKGEVDPVFRGTDGGDRITGTRYRDFINTRSGNDQALGRPANDAIFGDGGNDLLEGGSGADVIYGGSGNDSLYERRAGYSPDHRVDRLHGGPGTDTCYVLRHRDEWDGCERVVFVHEGRP